MGSCTTSPFIDGETLRDKLDCETQLGIDEAVKITAEIADALDYAYPDNVIHRDIKPENILLHDGRPIVADFGISLTVSAEKDLTNRADIYSLGSMLHERLTGDPAHIGGSAQAIIMKIVTEPAQPVTKIRKSMPVQSSTNR